jgi:hypothetical protein
MPATAEKNQALTEAAPERGNVAVFGLPVSNAEHWLEDGVHVLRSTEFDVIAGDPDFQRALEIFCEKAEDLWSYLSTLETISDNENEVFLQLAPRFMRMPSPRLRRSPDGRQG